MGLGRILWIAIVAALIISCSGPKVLTSSKTDATSFEAAGDFIKATAAWELFFSQTSIDETAGTDFAHAAKTAYKGGDLVKAKSWFDQARYKNYADAEMYETLAKIYKSEDNLSKELSALEYYTENFGGENSNVNARLFNIYYEIDSNEKALEMWGGMNDVSKNNRENLNKYFNINKALENSVICDSLSLELLKQNPENIDALEWNAKKYYWLGQNRYTDEMAKYNANKTRKNYNILLKELDLVTADFKKALPYLNKLWKLQPGKEYAGYLANIYALFGDEKKTNYYKNYVQ